MLYIDTHYLIYTYRYNKEVGVLCNNPSRAPAADSAQRVIFKQPSMPFLSVLPFRARPLEGSLENHPP